MSTTAMTLDRQSLLDAAESTPRLFAALHRIAAEGWNSSTGDVVLAYARREVVRPAVRSAGLTGSAAEAAEASGWSAAWEALAGASIRSAASPWGFVATAVRRAVLGERMAERYRTATRTAWRVEQFRAEGGRGSRRPGEWRAVADDAALARPLNLTALVEAGYDRPVTDQLPSEADPTIDLLAAVLVRGGWPRAAARESVLHIAEHGVRNRPEDTEVPGWRSLAISLGVPGPSSSISSVSPSSPSWSRLRSRMSPSCRALRPRPQLTTPSPLMSSPTARAFAPTLKVRPSCRIRGRRPPGTRSSMRVPSPRRWTVITRRPPWSVRGCSCSVRSRSPALGTTRSRVVDVAPPN